MKLFFLSCQDNGDKWLAWCMAKTRDRGIYFATPSWLPSPEIDDAVDLGIQRIELLRRCDGLVLTGDRSPKQKIEKEIAENERKIIIDLCRLGFKPPRYSKIDFFKLPELVA